MPNDDGLQDAAILMMSLGEAEASEVFKHLSPKEVQKLGEAIAKTTQISRERVDEVVDKFTGVAASQSLLVSNSGDYVRSVLKLALGDDKAALLIDRILQGGDVSGIESLKWMDPLSVAELLRNEHPQIVAAILVHLDYDQAAARKYGELRAHLDKQGTPIGPLDQQIAAHALSLGLTLVTNNLREFERVPGLMVENWVEPSFPG